MDHGHGLKDESMANENVFIGVDIGGTKAAVLGIDDERSPLSKDWLEVPADSHLGPEATIKQLVVGIKGYLQREKIDLKRVSAVGLDSPGPAGLEGRIQRSANMHPAWDGFELRATAQRAILETMGRQIPVMYENDCNAAALWESFVGDPHGTEVMALLAPGTGLGGGIAIHGQLLRGARGMGAELGHVEIVHPAFVEGWTPQCGCGQKHCAEAYASMAALTRILPVVLAQPKYKLHPLNQIPDGPDVWRTRAYKVRGLAAGGDELCLAIFDWQSTAIGKLCRQIADTIDPDRIVIGGGFIEGGEELTARILTNIRETFKELAFKKHAEEVRIERAAAGDQAGSLGAALSAWQHVHGKR